MKLSDIAKITMGQSPSSKDVYDYPNGIALLNGPTEFTDFSPIPKQYTNAGKKFSKNGDILFCVRGSTAGRMNFSNQTFAIGRGLAAISGYNGYTTEFIRVILENKLQDILNSATGSTFPNISRNQLLNIEIKNIDPNKANNIGLFYKSIYRKIELNTQTNQTLEQIAQAIFKHWFIDFAPVHAKANALASGASPEQAELATMASLSGKTLAEITALQHTAPKAYHQLQQTAAAFPSEFVETEMGEVPKGWGYKRAEDLFKIGIGKTPPRKESQWFSSNSKNNVEWISIKDMGNSGTHILNSSEYLTQEAIKNFNIKKIPENTVLLSFKLTIGRVSITTKETTTNEAIAHFKIGKSHLSTEFLYCYLKNFDFEQLGSTSSIATAVNSKTIKNMNILFPDIEVVNAFQKKISILFEKIKSNTKEISYLTSIRDELLPKLLNGEVEL